MYVFKSWERELIYQLQQSLPTKIQTVHCVMTIYIMAKSTDPGEVTGTGRRWWWQRGWWLSSQSFHKACKVINIMESVRKRHPYEDPTLANQKSRFDVFDRKLKGSHSIFTKCYIDDYNPYVSSSLN